MSSLTEWAIKMYEETRKAVQKTFYDYKEYGSMTDFAMRDEEV